MTTAAGVRTPSWAEVFLACPDRVIWAERGWETEQFIANPIPVPGPEYEYDAPFEGAGAASVGTKLYPERQMSSKDGAMVDGTLAHRPMASLGTEELPAVKISNN